MKNSLLAVIVILAIVTTVLLINSSAVTNEQFLKPIKSHNQRQEALLKSPTLEPALLHREAASNFGGLRLISWPGSNPIDDFSLTISNDNGQTYALESSGDGLVHVRPGNWRIAAQRPQLQTSIS
ncbi:MAG: hypothetical protein H8E25_10000 [Planctomycetes bacterium]|nr:hypothetical protein [Planctomycetota bacterium]